MVTSNPVERAFAPELSHGVDAAPRHNIPPSAQVFAVRHNPQTVHGNIDALHWRLVPHIVKERKLGFKFA